MRPFIAACLSLLLDLNSAIAGSGGAKWAKKLASAVKGADKALVELADDDAIGAIQALGKAAKSIAGAQGFAGAADLAERADYAAAYLADAGVDAVLSGGDPDDVATAVEYLEAGHALLVAGDHAGAIALYAKAARTAERAN